MYNFISFILLALLVPVFDGISRCYAIPFGYINVGFLLIAYIAYGSSKRVLYNMAITSVVVLYPLLILVYKKDPLNAGLPVLIFTGLLMGVAVHKDVLEELNEEWGGRLSEEKDRKRLISTEFDKLSALEHDAKDKEVKIISIYEITKKMSGSLKFEDIFSVLGAFLNDNFKFRKCELAILKRDSPPGEAQLDRIYNIWQSRRLSDYDYRLNYGALIKMLTEAPRVTYIVRDKDNRLFKELGIEGEEIGEFVAIPLLSEKKVVAILTADNMTKTDLEKFVMLSAQFALEIKKVLLYETVEELAITDGLTGLFVRRYFMERFNEELHRSKRYKFSFAFLMVDIDDFKKCNDTYGHLVGDVILKATARLMKEGVREIDLVSRYGGEEFALILPETGRDGAHLVAERLRKRIEENIFRAYDEKLKVTVSIGVCVYPEDAASVDGIIEKADSALYIAKRAGKNIVCEYKK